MEGQEGTQKLAQPDSPQGTEAGHPEQAPPSNLPAQERPTGDENTMGQEDWSRLLSLGKRPFLELTRSPEDLKAFQDLTGKGEGIFGKDKFAEQLNQKQAEEKARVEAEQRAQREAREGRANDMVAKMQSLADVSKLAMRDFLADFDAQQAERKADFDQRIGELKEKGQGVNTGSKGPEAALQTLSTDPQIIRARADLDWGSVLSGKPVEGLSPEFQQRIQQFRNNARMSIMRDPSGYQQQEQALRNEFLKLRGVNHR